MNRDGPGLLLQVGSGGTQSVLQHRWLCSDFTENNTLSSSMFPDGAIESYYGWRCSWRRVGVSVYVNDYLFPVHPTYVWLSNYPLNTATPPHHPSLLR